MSLLAFYVVLSRCQRGIQDLLDIQSFLCKIVRLLAKVLSKFDLGIQVRRYIKILIRISRQPFSLVRSIYHHGNPSQLHMSLCPHIIHLNSVKVPNRSNQHIQVLDHNLKSMCTFLQEQLMALSIPCPDIQVLQHILLLLGCKFPRKQLKA